jgi:protein arginine kinase activator
MQPKCTSCNAAVASVQIVDLDQGSVVGNEMLCEKCAAEKGSGIAKPQLELTQALIDNLLGLKGDAGSETARAVRSAAGPICPGCQLTTAEFRMRGRLGCPRCYDTFKAMLIPVFERVHDATSHRGRFPGGPSPALPPAQPQRGDRDDPSLTELRSRLDAAVREERYEEAARLRDLLQHAERERRGGRS